MTAPGRAFRSVDEYAAWCYLYCPWVAWRPTLGEAADAVRDHLRTEHADLWVECDCGDGHGPCDDDDCPPICDARNHPVCARCNGRGYIERNAS